MPTRWSGNSSDGAESGSSRVGADRMAHHYRGPPSAIFCHAGYLGAAACQLALGVHNAGAPMPMRSSGNSNDGESGNSRVVRRQNGAPY